MRYDPEELEILEIDTKNFFCCLQPPRNDYAATSQRQLKSLFGEGKSDLRQEDSEESESDKEDLKPDQNAATSPGGTAQSPSVEFADAEKSADGVRLVHEVAITLLSQVSPLDPNTDISCWLIRFCFAVVVAECRKSTAAATAEFCDEQPVSRLAQSCTLPNQLRFDFALSPRDIESPLQKF